MSEPELPFAINSVCWRHPLRLLSSATDSGALADEITEIATEKKAEKIVLGLPKNMDGSEGFRAEACRQLAELISERINLPIDFEDERLTTVSAHNALNATNTRGKKRKAVVDAVSAVIILEDYLRKTKNQK